MLWIGFCCFFWILRFVILNECLVVFWYFVIIDNRIVCVFGLLLGVFNVVGVFKRFSFVVFVIIVVIFLIVLLFFKVVIMFDFSCLGIVFWNWFVDLDVEIKLYSFILLCVICGVFIESKFCRMFVVDGVGFGVIMVIMGLGFGFVMMIGVVIGLICCIIGVIGCIDESVCFINMVVIRLLVLNVVMVFIIVRFIIIGVFNVFF